MLLRAMPSIGSLVMNLVGCSPPTAEKKRFWFTRKTFTLAEMPLDNYKNTDTLQTMNTSFLRNPDGSPRELVLVTSTGRVLTTTKDNPNWAKIQKAVEAKDEQLLINLVSLKESVRNFGSDVVGRGDITIVGDKVFYRNSQLYGEDVNRIIAYLSNNHPTESMILFLEDKLLNPSPVSVDALYMFLENKGMPITDNGTVLGYKGVRGDFFSINTGAEPLIEGTRVNGSIRNSIGDVIAMDRRYVCADNHQPCGPGLHIGSQNYAKNWAGQGRVMVVEFRPRDVVSVPTMEHEKLRVCRYRVVGELNGDYLGNTYNNDYVRPETAPDPDEASAVEIATEDAELTEILAEVEKTVAKARKIADYSNMYNISDWSKGQATGFKAGKAHAKRKFYECDRGRSFRRFSKEFVDGYLAGYRDGRSTNS